MRAGLVASMAGAATALAAADQLCHACVGLLDVDGASISVMHDGATRGTFGSSGEMSRHLDELQFTFGEGPCLDAVSQRRAVHVPDLADPAEQRWPAFREALLDTEVAAVFALPVLAVSSYVGALDLFRHTAGELTGDALTGGVLAAELAAVPLLDLMSGEVDFEDAAQGGDGWEQLASLERVEVYQATGMIVAALEVTAADALLRLRAYAYSHGMTASEVGYAIVERHLSLTTDDWQSQDGS